MPEQNKTPNKKDTSLRITQELSDDIFYLKKILEMAKEKGYSKEQAVEYAVKYTVENDKELYYTHKMIKYNVEKGRVYESYKPNNEVI